MNATVEDLRPTIVPKSDQLNSEQLLGGPITITVTDVRTTSSNEQPVVIHYAGENGRPYKPCLTMRKLLVHAWGANGLNWIGRSMTLFNDSTVKWAGEEVGGIRISHLTDIDRDLRVSLTSTRGKKAKYDVRRLASRITGQIADLAGSPTVEDLKYNFGAAYKATKDAGERAQLKAAYGKRMAELQLASPAKTLADFVADIDGATSKETAALVLDEAAQALSTDDMAKLNEAFDMAWQG